MRRMRCLLCCSAHLRTAAWRWSSKWKRCARLHPPACTGRMPLLPLQPRPAACSCRPRPHCCCRGVVPGFLGGWDPEQASAAAAFDESFEQMAQGAQWW